MAIFILARIRAGSRVRVRHMISASLTMAGLLTMPFSAHALDREIHVYDDSVANPGSMSLTLHNYYVASGSYVAAFDGAIVPDHSLTGGTEWTYGAREGVELGLYVPIISVSRQGRLNLDGAEARVLLLSPEARQQRVFHGLNLALNLNASPWSARQWGVELTPIVGVHFGAMTFSMNPRFVSEWEGVSRIGFSPAERLAYTASPSWSLSLEHYASWDSVNPFRGLHASGQQLFAVAQRHVDRITIEAGAGWGLTSATDHLTLKLIVLVDL